MLHKMAAGPITPAFRRNFVFYFIALRACVYKRGLVHTHSTTMMSRDTHTALFFFFRLVRSTWWWHLNAPTTKNDCIFLNMISFWYKRFFDGFLNYRQITAAWMADLKLYRPIYETISIKQLALRKECQVLLRDAPPFCLALFRCEWSLCVHI